MDRWQGRVREPDKGLAKQGLAGPCDLGYSFQCSGQGGYREKVQHCEKIVVLLRAGRKGHVLGARQGHAVKDFVYSSA